MTLAERSLHNRWYDNTTQALFAEVCAAQPDKVAIVFEGEEITYRVLQERVNQLSQGLISLGVGKGMWSPYCPARRRSLRACTLRRFSSEPSSIR